MRKMIGVYLLAFMAWTAAGIVLAQPPVRPTTDDHQETIRLINDERAAKGLGRLADNAQLSAAVQSQAEWMIRIDKMDHLQGEEPPRDWLRGRNRQRQDSRSDLLPAGRPALLRFIAGSAPLPGSGRTHHG